MPIENARNRHRSLLTSVGQAGVHASFPDDFEYYAVALELVNSNESTEDMLIFPVLPTDLNFVKTSIANVKKSSSGVVSLFNTSFVPKPISMRGTFGRKFRVLLNDNNVTISAISGVLSSGRRADALEAPSFSAAFKTGYGISKILDKLHAKSFTLDQYDKPYRVFFHNLAFNESYLVELGNLSWSQNESSSNRFWQYNLNMTAIAPASSVRRNARTSLLSVLLFDNVSSALTNTTDLLRPLVFQRLARLRR